MAQAIDRQGLDTLFVKARSLRSWVAGAEMVKVREGVLHTRIGHLRHRAGHRQWACTTRGFERKLVADGQRRLKHSDGVDGPSLEWEGMLR